MSTADEIKKLNDLLKDGVLTQEEYDSQKNKLLKSDSQSQNQWIVVYFSLFFQESQELIDSMLVKMVQQF